MDNVTTDLRQTGSMLWQRRATIAVATVIVLVAALGFSLTKPPVFQARARLVVRPVLPSRLFSDNTDPTSTLSPQTHAQIIASPIIGRRVVERLGLQQDPSTLASSIGVVLVTEEVFELNATAGTGELAASIANAFASEYLEYRREATIAGYEQAAETLRARVASIETRIADVEQRLTPAVGADARRLSDERGRLAARGDVLRARLEDTNVAIASATDGGEIVQPATAPRSAASPRPIRDGILGLIVGLAFGVGLALLRQTLDDRIRSRSDASRAAGVPVLAGVPRVRTWRVRGAAYLASIGDPGSEAAEAYRALRQSLIAMGLGTNAKTILVTSGGPRAGKTCTAANLGVVCAQAGLRVVLVSGDLRSPQLHAYLSVANGRGLSEVLLDTSSATDALVPTVVPGLSILVAGSAPVNAASLLDRKHLDHIFGELRADADVVIVDAPPLSSGADSAVFAPRADITLLVIRQAMARAQGTSRAVAELRAAGASRIAVVLNMADEQAAREYGETVLVFDPLAGARLEPPAEERPVVTVKTPSRAKTAAPAAAKRRARSRN